MRRTFRKLGVGTLAALTMLAAQAQPPGIAAAKLESYVDGLTHQAMQADHIAGVTVAIVQNGQPVLLKGYGIARADPVVAVDPQKTLFRIGSLSKTFTWIAVMQQVEQARLQLAAPIDNYLPPELATANPRFSSPIRVIDLMSHTAGYENRDFGRLFATDPAKLAPSEDYLAANKPERVRASGKFSTYSNYGTGLAAFAASQVSGKPFPSLIELGITGPLGMQSTTFREPHPPRADLPHPMGPELAAQVSDGFAWRGGRFQTQPFEYILVPAAGSASSTAADMAAFMLAQLGGGTLDGRQIYSSKTADAFRTPILKRPAGNNGWAHGFQVFHYPGGYAGYGHGGATQFFRTRMALVPDLGLGIFVSANTASADAFVSGFAEKVVRQVTQSGVEPARSSGAQRIDAARYEGHYLSTRRAYSGIQEMLGHLIGNASVSVSADGYLITRTSSARRWLPGDERGVFHSVDSADVIQFEFGPDGRAERWLSNSGTTAFERVGWIHVPAALLFLALATLVVSAGVLLRWPGRPAAAIPSTPEAWSIRLTRLASVLWLGSFLAFGVWVLQAMSGEPADWPGVALTLASYLALIAATCSMLLVTLLAVSITAAEHRRSWRLCRHSSIAILFVAFAGLLAGRGALSPWNS